METINTRRNRFSEAVVQRLRAIRVPIGLIVITLLGLLAWWIVPGVGPLVALRSARAIAPFEIVDIPSLVIQLATYWLVPVDLKSWFEISWAVLLMSFILGERMTNRTYVLSLAIGAGTGGVAFIVTGPDALLIGPTMAGHGLLGFYCLATLRMWRTLHLVSKLFSLWVYAVLGYILLSTLTEPPSTRIAEAVAAILSFVVATRLVPPRPRTISGERDADG